MPPLTVLMVDGDLLQHRHQMLTHHLPGLDPALQRFQLLLITTHVREVTVEMRMDREAKAVSRQVDIENRVLDLLGSNLTYLLHLIQVASHEDLSPVWKELAGGLKHQHLTRALDDTAQHLSVRAPIVTIPGLLKLTLALGLRLEHRDTSGLGLH